MASIGSFGRKVVKFLGLALFVGSHFLIAQKAFIQHRSDRLLGSNSYDEQIPLPKFSMAIVLLHKSHESNQKGKLWKVEVGKDAVRFQQRPGITSSCSLVAAK